MLKLVSLSMTNFGAYKGEQAIEFPSDDGVTIVYGDNMRGKTTLLNAIRFALFGKVLTRGSRELGVHSLCNILSTDEGDYGFIVSLKVDSGGRRYEVTRSVSPHKSMNKPTSDADYQQDIFVKRDGMVLGVDEGKAELTRIMPEQVSRFFLFDGELLQEYEELIRDDTLAGRRISEAIERILGLPVLSNAKLDVQELRNWAEKEEASLARKDKKTQEYGKQLEAASARRSFQEAELEKLKTKRAELEREKQALEALMRQSAAAAALMDERDRLTQDIKGLESRLANRQARLREVMKEAWRSMLSSRLNTLLGNCEAKVTELGGRATARRVKSEMEKRVRDSIDARRCVVCDTELSDELVDRLARTLPAEVTVDAEGAELESYTALVARIKGLNVRDISNEIKQVLASINDDTLELSTKASRVEDLQAEIDGVSESEVLAARGNHERAIAEITHTKDAITATEKSLEDIDTTIKGLQKHLPSSSGSDMDSIRKKREMLGYLADLFGNGIDVYRERLRGKVQADATSLFRKLTTEPEYDSLRINQNYGLTIIHKDGSVIPNRSAGAEHVVALSLMGALQKNAPLRGPIVMDSPFGRLDLGHTQHIITTLPFMADQVVLLVSERELEPELARRELLGRLKAEYRLVRQSGRHTTIERWYE